MTHLLHHISLILQDVLCNEWRMTIPFFFKDQFYRGVGHVQSYQKYQVVAKYGCQHLKGQKKHALGIRNDSYYKNGIHHSHYLTVLLSPYYFRY